MFGNDLSTFPNFPAEIRAPPGTLAGVSSFQLHFADHDILTPGDRPDVLVAMNPAALKANLGDVPKGATLIIDTHDFTDRALARIGWTSNPLEDGTLDGLHRPRRSTSPSSRSTRSRTRAVPQGRRPVEEHVRARAAVLDVLPADRGHARVHRGRSSPTSRTSPRRTSPRSRPAATSARRPRRSRSPTRSSRRALPAGTYRNITGNLALAYGLIAAVAAVRAAAVPRRVPDHAGIGHPARAVQAQALRRADVPGRGRDRRHRRGARRGVRRRARGHHVLRARASRSRARRSGWPCRSSCRWSSATSSAAARRPGCRPRPSSPTCCRRCTAATARRRCRSSPRSRRATASTPRSRRRGSR